MLPPFLRNRETKLQQQCREWFLASRHALLAYARQQVDSDTDVELLIADVSRRVTRAICVGHVPEEDIAPYTLRSLYNGAAELRRKNAHRLEAERRYCEGEHIHGQLHQNDGPCGLEDQHILARQALKRLPEELSTIITLRLWNDLTFAKIAEKLQLPETNVRRRFDQGIKKIKKILNQS